MVEQLSVAAAKRGRRSQNSGTIESIQITGGFLDGVTLPFDPALNCIIGARGTGKTSVVELIRFALDLGSRQDELERRRLDALVRSNLGAGEVALRVTLADGTALSVHREAEAKPRTLLTSSDGASTSAAAGFSGRQLRADVYSQNQIERIAEQPGAQLALIDGFERDRIELLNGDIHLVVQALQSNGSASPAVQIEALQEGVAGLPMQLERLKQLGPMPCDPAGQITAAQKERSRREWQTHAIESVYRELGQFDRTLESFVGVLADRLGRVLRPELFAGPHAAIMEGLRDRLTTTADAVDAALRKARHSIGQTLADVDELTPTLEAAHAEQDQGYQRLLASSAAVRVQANERAAVQKSIDDLQSKARLLTELRATADRLRRERADLLARLSELRDERYRIRCEVAERINAALAPAIRVRVDQAGQIDGYAVHLESLLANARIKHGIVARRIAERLSPAEFVELVRAGDVRRLELQTGINAEQARKVVDCLRDRDVLEGLEMTELADLPRIELKDGGEYKESGSLSTGQKCTTVLPILLLNGVGPLLIDQPEDNLDNRFICESVVQSIRAVKTKRQLIFVTHNPNIPVLADAERVFVLDSDGQRARVLASGSVDDCRDPIVNLLEGGAKAFTMRQQRYAFR